MAGSNRTAAALTMSVALVVVMAMVAEASAAHSLDAGDDPITNCNPNSLYPCLPAIKGALPPPPSLECCSVVQSVDKICMCNQVRSYEYLFPAQMVHNGLQLPKKCGRTDLGGFHCGRYTFPY